VGCKQSRGLQVLATRLFCLILISQFSNIGQRISTISFSTNQPTNQPTNQQTTSTITMPPFCDYNAGILDISEHSTVKPVENDAKDSLYMNSPLHNSAPVCNFNFDLEELLDAVVQQTKKQKKCVSFADYDEIREITHLSEMSSEDIDAMYMSGQEQAACRSSALDELMAALDDGCQLTDEQEAAVCIRGLENQNLESMQKFREVVEKLYDVVYECQTFEDENGVKVPDEYLAQYLIQISEQCSIQAQLRGMQDAKEASIL
jgi:hypothetical protein